MKKEKSIFPPIEVPIIGANGKVNVIWYRFFVALFRRTGSEEGATPDPGDIEKLISDIQGVRLSESDSSISLYRDLAKRVDQIQLLLATSPVRKISELPGPVVTHQKKQILPEPVSVLQSLP